MSGETTPLSRLRELYADGGLSRLYRGIRDFLVIRVDRARWTVGATLNRSQTVSVRGHETDLKTDTPIEYRRAKTQMNERDVLEDFVASIHPDDVIWDVGSNIGLYAAFAATIADEAVAVEPVPANVAALRGNLARNDLSKATTVIEAALGPTSDTIDVPEAPSAGENHTLIGSTDETATTTAPVRRGDELIETGDVPTPTVLKMDIEGGEADALDGLETALRNVRLAYIEVHGNRLASIDRSIDDVADALRTAGLDPQPLDSRRDDNYHLRAERV